MRSNRSWAAVLVALSMATTACSFEHTSELLTPTMPSVDGTSAPVVPGAGLMGLWTSAAPLGDPATWVCGSFQWNITEQTPTSLSGSFSGLCGGIVLVQGNGTGQLNGETVTLTVAGQASMSGVLTTCPFSITASGFLEGDDAIHVNYSGSTCLGPVQGSEVLRRPNLSLPPAPPAPPAPPSQQTPPQTSGNPFHVGPGALTADRAHEVLEAVADEFPHLAGAHPTGEQTVAAAHELLLRYIWHLQQAGFSAGRQRNPSGAISGDKLTIWLENQWKSFDIFFDVGTANRPAEIIFWEVFPADHVPDGGIPD